MPSQQLHPERTALLLFDMLNGHLKKDDAATQQRYRPVIAAASMLLGAAREHDTVVAYAAANHRADNATRAPTIRDADASMRPIQGRPASAVPAHRDGLRLAGTGGEMPWTGDGTGTCSSRSWRNPMAFGSCSTTSGGT